MTQQALPKRAWCVRADFGSYTKAFVRNGYAAIGWVEGSDLSSVATREDVAGVYRRKYPGHSNIVVGQQVGQISRFLLEIEAGDIVVTPDSNAELIQYGFVESGYFYAPDDPECPFPHRRKVRWEKAPLPRSSFSVPLQNTLRSSLTVFSISQVSEILVAIGALPAMPPRSASDYDPYDAVLKQILELDDKEFEILVAHLLTALGFEGSEVVGKVGDGGVDATGELDVSGLARIKLFVQAKRYKPGNRISAGVVRTLRQAIPFGGQGAFITTADFQRQALEIAIEAGFPRIGLINGRQLVDLLVAHWDDIPSEFRERLGLKRGLVLA
jgi:restriction system protein